MTDSISSSCPPQPPQRLPDPDRPAASVVQALHAELSGRLDWAQVRTRAAPWIEAVRRQPAPFWAVESLLHEYPLSSAEGRALMRLAEALLRVPDTETAAELAADQLGRAAFAPAELRAGSAHPLLAGLTARVLGWARHLLPGAEGASLMQRLGAPTVVAAAVRAVQLLGRQFVLGRDIDAALAEAARQRRGSGPQLRFSFDMLGEGARCDADALRYHAAYAQAIARIAAQAVPGHTPEAGDGISVKLSALFPRYEDAQHGRVMRELLPRAQQLLDAAARANLNLTLDAEESERLELSLDVLDALMQWTAQAHPQWQGLGLAVQAYQTRSHAVVDEVVRLARAHRLRLMVRLVKGAYWDAEIKRAQELGLSGYPVFTHKPHTDLAYLACAQALLAAGPQVYPQFATHNAGTLAAVLQLAEAAGLPTDGRAFEWQRLHGMGEAVYRELGREPGGAGSMPVRIYAPVGEHRDLLAYLVRRLLENGANASFVHQLSDEQVSLDHLLTSPLATLGEAGTLPPPEALYGPGRPNARGVDLACRRQRAALLATTASATVPTVPLATPLSTQADMTRLMQAAPGWQATPLAERCAVLQRAADILEARLPDFCRLLVHEGRKTLPDAVGEVRELVDACRYYAEQAALNLAPRLLPGPTGERNEWRLRGRGVFVCISPWNFPLAIFGAQVAAALVAGNTVAAKPAEQTPAVAQAFVQLLIEAGVPPGALALVHGPGETVGAALVAHPACAGVAFTGSGNAAKHIQRALAAGDGPIVPLIAETGGLNAMIVDSSALPEQVVDAAVASAFGSAGQRCSALRLLCLHAGIAEGVLDKLAGAIRELQAGPGSDPATDVPPVIDAEAAAHLQRHIARLEREARLVARGPLPAAAHPDHVAPVAFEIGQVAELREEIFGPVLHVVRWGPGCAAPDLEALVEQVNALGFGLTLGVQTRIDRRAQQVALLARVGNVYINRGMTGAVIGVQPFGGEGLSGSGPKAGGPLYVPRFAVEQTVTINTAAAGGNADLLGGA